MSSSNIRDLLTAFSPRFEFFAVSSGDGRIKIWDTLKGHLQVEFTNIVSTEEYGTEILQPKFQERGHLSLDYKCMQWVQLGNKKKRKSGNLFLVLGTGSGDVLALDVSSGTLKWKISDCHPGGVSSISFSKDGYVYSGGVDGIVCHIDAASGNLIRKLRASTKAVSSISVSPDGSMLATASSQLKVFNCSDDKKIQKFSGHPVGVRCMIFSDDNKYILSSGVGEKSVVLWKLNRRKKQSSFCVLSVDHPPVFLTCKNIDSNFCILTICENGVCYFWREKTPEDLKNSKNPSKITVSAGNSLRKNHDIYSSSIFSAKIQGVISPASVMVLFAYGSVVKPIFEKLSLEAGVDVNLSPRPDSVLLPMDHSYSSLKDQTIKSNATALDRANAEDAMMPLAKIYDSIDKKRKNTKSGPIDERIVDAHNEGRNKENDGNDNSDDDHVTFCVEDMLKSAGILSSGNDVTLIPNHGDDPRNLVGMNLPPKKVKSIVLSMSPPEALNFLEALLTMWRSCSVKETSVLPWISSVLIHHGHFIVSRDSSVPTLSALYKMSGSKSTAIQSLLQLSGRLLLFSTQVGGGNNDPESNLKRADESDVEDGDIDDVIYGEEHATSDSDLDDHDDQEMRH